VIKLQICYSFFEKLFAKVALLNTAPPTAKVTLERLPTRDGDFTRDKGTMSSTFFGFFIFFEKSIKLGKS